MIISKEVKKEVANPNLSADKQINCFEANRKMNEVADKINTLHSNLVRNNTEVSIEIGRLLNQQKDALGYGSWVQWREKHIKFSASTAKRYMALHKHQSTLPEEEKTKLVVLNLGEAYKEATKKTPEEKKDRTKYLRKQDKERSQRRKKFAHRGHQYENPPKGHYENKVLCGRFEDIMPEMLENGMRGKFDALASSIPYYNSKDYGDVNIADIDYSEYLAMIEKFIKLSYELLRKGGRLILNFDETTTKGAKGDRHYMLESDIVCMIRNSGLELYELDKIIWYKKNSGSDWLPGSCSPLSPKLKNKFETILVYYKQEDVLPNIYGTSTKEEDVDDYSGNVWEIHPISHSNPHPATYPEELTDNLLKLYTWEGSLVGDFFCGSGTTLKSAQQLNRRYCGIDQNPNFAQYSRDRLDMTKEELKAKYADYVGGKVTTSKEVDTKKPEAQEEEKQKQEEQEKYLKTMEIFSFN